VTELRALGRTGMRVSALGLGAGPLGDLALADGAAEDLVRRAVDLGIALVDTAPSYGRSEERVGRALRGERRERVVLVTKGGYGVPGVADWTPAIVEAGIARACERMATWLDVFLLHSCDAATLEAMLPALVRARAGGRVRAIGYSGDGDALAWAARCGELDVVECSVNVVDQHALGGVVGDAAARGVGVLAKRALANAAWTHATRPARDDTAIYWERARAMGVALTAEAAVRFAAHAPGVSCALVGTRDAAHLDEASAAAARGPLPAARVAEIRTAFAAHGRAWAGVV
jgi:aryl-alcohol dehydrogenase-like predicted oxidoreductase